MYTGDLSSELATGRKRGTVGFVRSCCAAFSAAVHSSPLACLFTNVMLSQVFNTYVTDWIFCRVSSGCTFVPNWFGIIHYGNAIKNTPALLSMCVSSSGLVCRCCVCGEDSAVGNVDVRCCFCGDSAVGAGGCVGCGAISAVAFSCTCEGGPSLPLLMMPCLVARSLEIYGIRISYIKFIPKQQVARMFHKEFWCSLRLYISNKHKLEMTSVYWGEK